MSVHVLYDVTLSAGAECRIPYAFLAHNKIFDNKCRYQLLSETQLNIFSHIFVLQ
jgi:hypothetical protein